MIAVGARGGLVVGLVALAMAWMVPSASAASAASAGQLYAFGDNYTGQLGNVTNNGTGNANPTPSLVALAGASGSVVQVAAGDEHSLAVTSTGQLYAFGDNAYGELGIATNSGTSTANPTAALVVLPGASGSVVQIAAGYQYSLALTSTGQLYAFGDNFYGQLGKATNNGNNNANPTPSLVSLPGENGPVVQVAAGANHSLAVTSTGQLYAFGDNAYGELGNATNNGNNNANPTPALVALPGENGPVVQVAAGTNHSLAVTSTGQLYAFGENSFGQLGNAANSGNNTANPTLVSVAGGATIDTVARGPEAQHSLAVIAALAVSTSSLPRGTVGAPYSATAQATGGSSPYTWVAQGLPPGLRINRSTGQITGTPTSAAVGTATLRVTDRDGITAGRSVAVTIAALPAPKLTGLGVAPRKFTLAGRKVNGRCVEPTAGNTHRPRCSLPLKLQIRFKLTAANTVKFTLKLLLPGRKVNRRCVKPTAKNAKHTRCVEERSVRGSLTTSAKAGADSFTFTGKVGGHKLAPGTYQLTATPTGGNSQTTTFTIKR
jgi:hypothetical protein